MITSEPDDNETIFLYGKVLVVRNSEPWWLGVATGERMRRT